MLMERVLGLCRVRVRVDGEPEYGTRIVWDSSRFMWGDVGYKCYEDYFCFSSLDSCFRVGVLWGYVCRILSLGSVTFILMRWG